VRKKEIDGLFQNVKVAEIAEVPDLVSRLAGYPDSPVIDRLGILFEAGRPVPQLIAGFVLGKRRPECRQFCYDRLLEAEPQEIAPIARLLEATMPELTRRLEDVVEGAHRSSDPEADPERHERRRANAACALIHLGHDARAWPLLSFSPDPQARSFLIQRLGPSGVHPGQIRDRLIHPGTKTPIRRALIQSLDGIAGDVWNPDLREKVMKDLLELYENDPDSGVHGSAKWLLRRWGAGAKLDQIDQELAERRPSDPRFQWRISRMGLTLITVDDPRLDHVIEVSDTEITVAMFRRFNREAYVERKISPEDSCPAGDVTYYDAAAFCNWLTEKERIDEDSICYRPTSVDQHPYVPSPRHADLGGFRLPTNPEFDVLCAAGTSTRRYHGNSDSLFGRYAWTMMNAKGKAHPVASLIPNDLGVFDTLGNLQEWCETSAEWGPPHARADLRGGWCSQIPPDEIDRSMAVRVPLITQDPTEGFRVVRTKSRPHS
jgi:hypothetical protein